MKRSRMSSSDDEDWYNCEIELGQKTKPTIDDKDDDSIDSDGFVCEVELPKTPSSSSIPQCSANLSNVHRTSLEFNHTGKLNSVNQILAHFTPTPSSSVADVRSAEIGNGIKRAKTLIRRLPEWVDLKKRNVKVFNDAAIACHQFRKTRNCAGFDVDMLPDIDNFITSFTKLTDSDQCGMYQQMRIGGVQSSTIRRAGSAGILFLTFTKQSKLIQLNEDDEANNNGYLDAVRNHLLKMSTNEKSDLIIRFIVWYEKIPAARQSSGKFIQSRYDISRSLVKENSTMRTIARGLFAFLTYISVIQPSSNKRPTDESKTLWDAVNATLKTCSIRKGGDILNSKGSISVSDLIELMTASDGVRDVVGLQSWLLGVLLSGTGLRVSSIRRSVKQADLLHCSEVEEDWEDDETDNEQQTLEIDFDSLKAKDVIVYRMPKQDATEPCRLYVLLRVTSSKTTGNCLFKPQMLGYNFPSLRTDEQEEWIPGTALALALLSVLAGDTKIESLTDDESEPKSGTRNQISLSSETESNIPLLRAYDHHGRLKSSPLRNIPCALTFLADSLRIPQPLFTSKAFRKGFARSIIVAVVCEGSPYRIVTNAEIQEAMFSCARWRSTQAGRYIEDVTRYVVSSPTTNCGITAFDWRGAAYESSPLAKQSYNHLNLDNLEQYLEQNVHEPVDLSVMNRKQKVSLVNALNVKHWNECPSSSLTPEQKLAVLKTSRKLDLKATLISFQNCVESDVNFQPFAGFGRGQTTPPYTCPINECSVTFSHVHETVQHWNMVHKLSYQKERFICMGCKFGEESSSKSYSNHLRKHHFVEPVNFKWQYQD